MKGIIEYLKKEVERSNIKMCRVELASGKSDIIIFDEESKEFMIFGWDDIVEIKSLNIETELKEVISKKINPLG